MLNIITTKSCLIIRKVAAEKSNLEKLRPTNLKLIITEINIGVIAPIKNPFIPKILCARSPRPKDDNTSIITTFS